ncbi:MAG: diaminopimelate epimerase, partial [Haloechinothrix sp.]
VHVLPDRTVTVHMGPAQVTGKSTAKVAGQEYSGVAVDVGNPHLVSVIDSAVADLDLRDQPSFDGRFFPHGVNVEFINRISVDTLRMRVYERGVGETRACGTGTVAAVAADLHLSGADAGARTVHVPGGTVEVTVEPGASTLTGPAVILASGEFDTGWWNDPA